MDLLPSRLLSADEMLASHRPRSWNSHSEFIAYLRLLSGQSGDLKMDLTILELLKLRPWGQDDSLVNSLAPLIIDSQDSKLIPTRVETILDWQEHELLPALLRRAGLEQSALQIDEDGINALLKQAEQHGFPHYPAIIHTGLDSYSKELVLRVGRITNQASIDIGRSSPEDSKRQDLLEKATIIAIAISNRINDPDGLKYYLRDVYDQLISDLIRARSAS